MAAAQQSGLRYRKDAIREGRFFAPNPAGGAALELPVDGDRLNRWVSAFRRMQANGVKVDLTIDHNDSAEAKRGEVVDLFRARIDDDGRVIPDPKGPVLGFDCDFADADAAKLAHRCPEVSIELEPAVEDGAGNTYGEAITAISIARQPVVGGQAPFQKIAASQGARTDDKAVVALAANTATTPASTGSNSPMFTDEQKQQIREKLGLDESAGDDQMAEGLMGLLDKPAEVEQLSQQVDTLKTEKAELSRANKPIQLSQDVRGVLEEGIDTKIDTLVTQHKLTPDAADKLKASLKTGPTMLSREANGGEQSRAMQIIAALETNDPAQLVTLTTQHSRTQTLSRQVEGDASGPDDWVGEELKAANGGD
jgi:hypothetical protein